jgi:type I restriction enzyme, S subunit
MRVKAGYKQTEAGVIPEDWEVQPFSEVATLERGKFTARPRNDPKYFGGMYPFIQTGDVANSSGAITSFCQTLNEAGLGVSKLFRRDTLFFTIAANIGDLGFTTFDSACPDSLVAITPNSKLDKRWLYHELKSRKRAFEGLATQNAQLNINLEKLRPYPLPIPPLPEQRDIATALSDVDALLAKLDQLIAKKRDLKQAAMQQLLTGKTRLPGFSGGWEYVPMRSLGQTYGGLAGKTKTDFGHGAFRYIPFMNVMLNTVINTNWFEHVSIGSNETQNLARRGDLFFNGSSETPEEVGYCAVLLDEVTDVCLNSFCFGFRFNAGTHADGLFFAYWFRGTDGRTAMSVLAQGATRYNISKAAFLQLAVPLPHKEEQTAIARVLSDIDADITALEARRDKTRALKQGMMQVLLTGQIRLI